MSPVVLRGGALSSQALLATQSLNSEGQPHRSAAHFLQLSAALVLHPASSCPVMPRDRRPRQRAGNLRLPRCLVPVRATAAGAAAGHPSDKEALVKSDVGDPAQAQAIPGPRVPAGQACNPVFYPVPALARPGYRLVPGSAQAHTNG